MGGGGHLDLLDDLVPVILQGVGDIEPRLANWWAYAGHKALVDGLTAVEQALMQLEAGQVRRVQRDVGPPRTYTYPGLSHELKRWWTQSTRSTVVDGSLPGG